MDTIGNESSMDLDENTSNQRDVSLTLSFTNSVLQKRVIFDKKTIDFFFNLKHKSLSSVFSSHDNAISFEPTRVLKPKFISLEEATKLNKPEENVIIKISKEVSPLWFLTYLPNKQTSVNPYVVLNQYFYADGKMKDLPSFRFNWSSLFQEEEISVLKPERKFFVHLVLEWLKSYSQRSFWIASEKDKAFKEQIKKKNPEKDEEVKKSESSDMMVDDNSYLESNGTLNTGTNQPNDNNLNFTPIKVPETTIATLKPAMIIDSSIFEKPTRELIHSVWSLCSSFPLTTIPSPLLQLIMDDDYFLCSSSLLTSYHLTTISNNTYNFCKLYSTNTSNALKKMHAINVERVSNWYRNGLKYLLQRYKSLICNPDGSFIKHDFFDKNNQSTGVLKQKFIEDFIYLQHDYHTRRTNLHEIFAYQVFLGLTEESEFNEEYQKKMTESVIFKKNDLKGCKTRFASLVHQNLKYPDFDINLYSDCCPREESSSTLTGTVKFGENLINTMETKERYERLYTQDLTFTPPKNTATDSDLNQKDKLSSVPFPDWKFLISPNTIITTRPFSGTIEKDEENHITKPINKVVEKEENHNIKYFGETIENNGGKNQPKHSMGASIKLFNITTNISAIMFAIYYRCLRVQQNKDFSKHHEKLALILSFIKTGLDGKSQNPWLTTFTEILTTQTKFLPKLISMTLVSANDVMRNMVVDDLSKMSISEKEPTKNEKDKQEEGEFLTKSEKLKFLESYVGNYDKSAKYTEAICQPNMVEYLSTMEETGNLVAINLFFPQLGFFKPDKYFVEDITLDMVKTIYASMTLVYLTALFNDRIPMLILESQIPYYTINQIKSIHEDTEKQGLGAILGSSRFSQTKFISFYEAALTVQSHLICYCSSVEMKI